MPRAFGKRKRVDESRMVRRFVFEVEAQIIIRRHAVTFRIGLRIDGVIGERERERVALMILSPKLHGNAAVGPREFQRLCLRIHHARDFEQFGVKRAWGKFFGERRERDGVFSPKSFLFFIKAQREAIMPRAKLSQHDSIKHLLQATAAPWLNAKK